MAIIPIGFDLTKNVVAVHGVDEFGKPTLVRPIINRAALLEVIAKLPPCLPESSSASRRAQALITGRASLPGAAIPSLDGAQVRGGVPLVWEESQERCS